MFVTAFFNSEFRIQNSEFELRTSNFVLTCVMSYYVRHDFERILYSKPGWLKCPYSVAGKLKGVLVVFLEFSV